MLLTIRHTTRYRFESPVRYGLQHIRKTPKSTHGQSVREWSTDIVGGKKELFFEDHHQNVVELISFAPETTELSITSQGTVEVQDTHGVLGPHTAPAPLWLFRRVTPRTQAGPGVKALVKQVEATEELDALHQLSDLLYDAVAYDLDVTETHLSAEEVLAEGRGVCQDHTHVFIAAARAMGMPARYVSGYLMLDDRTDQQAMHAWAEAHVEGLGWVGFDVPNRICPDMRYVRVATGLDYRTAAPVTGTRNGGGDETLDVTIDVAQQ